MMFAQVAKGSNVLAVRLGTLSSTTCALRASRLKRVTTLKMAIFMVNLMKRDLLIQNVINSKTVLLKLAF